MGTSTRPASAGAGSEGRIGVPGNVEAALLHLQPSAAALARLIRLSGMSPGEACRVRLADVERGPGVWAYRLAEHKTAHHGKGRVALGPRAQAVLRDFIRARWALWGAEGRPPRLASPDGALCGACARGMDEAGVFGPWPRQEVQPADAFLLSPLLDREERFEDMRAGGDGGAAEPEARPALPLLSGYRFSP